MKAKLWMTNYSIIKLRHFPLSRHSNLLKNNIKDRIYFKEYRQSCVALILGPWLKKLQNTKCNVRSKNFLTV